MSQYSDMIRIEGEYNYSANIQFDMENDRKLLRFIPNETTIELIKEYFVDITRAKPVHHARILYGSYGTGKSHFLTVLSMLLGKKNTSGNAYNSFVSKVASYDENLAQDINHYIHDTSRKPFLVVPVVFDFEDFDRCLYFSLKKRLDEIGKKVGFKTFFDQASTLISNWESNPESKERLGTACEKTGISIENLKKALWELDRSAEQVFQRVFAEMTFGVRYIYEVANLSENICQANEAIEDEYSGIVFIFDEFGRYIEDNIKNIKVKAVQDLAEFCDHSESNNHIILVSHKEIAQYTQKYGKTVANEWKKVEGRYKATPINDRQDQCLSLIRNVLTKDEQLWNSFRLRFKNELSHMYSEASDFRGFLLDAAQGHNPFEGGFPLHPISLYALDKLSKRVAQNERTFFTYLASKDENSLYRYLETYSLDEFHFVGIDKIYDYFEPSIKATQSDTSFEWYKELQIALAKNRSSSVDDSPETRILKVIATIGIINDPSTLNANKSTILSVIDCPKEVIANALEGLCERKIIKYSGAYDRFDFFEASIFDVEEMISTESQSVTDEAVVSVLNERFVNFALYPYEYNRVYKISRIFIPVFATLQSAQKKTFANRFGKYYDGLLILLLGNQDVSEQSIVSLSGELQRSIVFAKLDTTELKTLVKRYIAVLYLESQKAKYISQDPAFEKELEYYKEELHVSIINQIHQWKSQMDYDSILAADGAPIRNISSFSELSSVASDLMTETYPETLIVNNELINKNVISGSITSAKKNVVSNIIKGSQASQYYDAPFLSPDYISIRSVLAKNGFIVTDEPIEINELPNGKHPQDSVREELYKFVTRAKTEMVGFDELYTTLKEPPFGLRNGYLSLLLAHILIPFRKSLIISSHGVEQELSVDLFEEIVRRPNDYAFTIADWDKAQIDYLDSLEQIFADYINQSALSKNRLKAIYDAMMSHFKNVTKFARTTQEYVSEETKVYRKVLGKSVANYSTFLFTKLKNIGGGFPETVLRVKRAKTELDDAISSLARDLVSSICTLFSVPVTTSLGDLFVDNYENVWKAKRSKSFDYYTNAFLDLASKVTRNESDYDIVLKLSKALTGFELVYWNDSHRNEFINQLDEVKHKLDSYVEKSVLGETEAKVMLLSSSGEEKSVIIDRGELSVISQTVRNKIKATFDNYGLSFSYNDRIQVLLSLLEEAMEGK